MQRVKAKKKIGQGNPQPVLQRTHHVFLERSQETVGVGLRRREGGCGLLSGTFRLVPKPACPAAPFMSDPMGSAAFSFLEGSLLLT